VSIFQKTRPSRILLRKSGEGKKAFEFLKMSISIGKLTIK